MKNKEEKKFYDDLDFQTKKIKVADSRVSDCTLEKAQRIAYIKYKELFSQKYSSFTEYCTKVLELPKTTASEYTQVVYKFCKESEFSNTGYCVKSLFSDYSYSQLNVMKVLTEEEIRVLKINPSLSVRQIHKIVLEHKKNITGIKDLKPLDDEIEERSGAKQPVRDMENISTFKFYDCDKCNMKDMKKTISTKEGLDYLRNRIVKDNDNIYYVVVVPKNRL